MVLTQNAGNSLAPANVSEGLFSSLVDSGSPALDEVSQKLPTSLTDPGGSQTTFSMGPLGVWVHHWSPSKELTVEMSHTHRHSWCCWSQQPEAEYLVWNT